MKGISLQQLESWIREKPRTDLSTPPEKREGLYAELYPDGDLKQLAWFSGGGMVPTGYCLTLEHDREAGVASRVGGSDDEVYEDGRVRARNAWSDDDPERTMKFEDWAKKWAVKIHWRFSELSRQWSELGNHRAGRASERRLRDPQKKR